MILRSLLYTLFLLLSVTFFEVANGQSARSNCSATPDPVNITQADGSVLTVMVKGNEALSYTETTDGYTVVQNKNGIYEYAVNGAQGMLVAGGLKAKNPEKRNMNEAGMMQWISKHQHHGRSIEEAFLSSHNAKRQTMNKQLSWGFPSKGNRKVLMILMQYPDKMAALPDTSFDNFMNEPKFRGTGSFRDFYLENSYQQLDLNTDVVGWFTASNNYVYYGKRDPDYYSHVTELIAQAIDSAEGLGVDFSKYDNDSDGNVDGILVIHSGTGAEAGNDSMIWSHRSALYANPAFYDGVEISDYGIMPELRGTNQVGIGVFCHEFGHILGLPDLYDTDNNNGDSEGIGEWGVMGGGSWLGGEKTPCHFDAWCKMRLDWIHPVLIDTIGSYSLDPATSDSTVYRLNTKNTKEYFLLENRQKKKFDAALKGNGLAIWQINEVRTGRFPNSNDVNGDENNKGVGLKEADGLKNLDFKVNRGDGGDLYPGTSLNVLFDNYSTPNSRLINGDSTMHSISEIKETSGIITFNVGAKPVASFLINKTFGCAPVIVQYTNASKFSNKQLWNFGDGTVDSVKDVSHQYDSAGVYVTTLYAYNPDGTVADSSKKNITVNSYAIADFSFTQDSFTAVFTNLSQNSIFYIWNFGDGSAVVNTKNPVHDFPGNNAYQVRLIANNPANCLDTVYQTVEMSWVSIAENSSPFSFSIGPNPFSNQTVISYRLSNAAQLNADIYNLLGEKVTTLSSGMHDAGTYQLLFEPATLGLSEGIYLLKFNSGEFNQSYRLLYRK